MMPERPKAHCNWLPFTQRAYRTQIIIYKNVHMYTHINTDTHALWSSTHDRHWSRASLRHANPPTVHSSLQLHSLKIICWGGGQLEWILLHQMASPCTSSKNGLMVGRQPRTRHKI